MTRETMFNHICNNYDNLDILSFVKDLLFVVINDVEYMRNFENDYRVDYNLGNNNYIKNEDLESVVSITDTISKIEQYNNKYDIIFLEEQFDNALDEMLEDKVITKKQYDYYMDLYYNEKDYKEDFIENVLDKLRAQ